MKFLGIWLVAIVLLSTSPGLEAWAIRSTIASLRIVVEAAGHDFRASEGLVRIGRVDLLIVPDCTSLMATIVLWSVCLAFPTTWRWKVLGLVGGAAVLWVYNVMRVLALVVVKARWPAAFDFVHAYVWQTATLLVVFVLFLGWLGLQTRVRAERARDHEPLPGAVAPGAVAVPPGVRD